MISEMWQNRKFRKFLAITVTLVVTLTICPSMIYRYELNNLEPIGYAIGFVVVLLFVWLILGRDIWNILENESDDLSPSDPLQRFLEEGESFSWKTECFYKGKKDTLYFTSRRLIWNVRKQGIFSKKLDFDDIPYKTILKIDPQIHSKTKAVLTGRCGILIVESRVGDRKFEFGVNSWADLEKAENGLRYPAFGVA